uniref:uncharacterized protein LOC113475601 n=1 Tax=Ciona intestinalis TaxID=7719 RepID=UPI000EF476D0|nr:uncharacterized protein LOC113475601 [Ciona intestinalis]|eukprot:XP_026695737.1 uncharacterized protein LOC113475601 [Ciona intestinalis]
MLCAKDVPSLPILLFEYQHNKFVLNKHIFYQHLFGRIFSVDNRRLYVFRVLEKAGCLHSIKVQVINQFDEERFTSTNNGCHARLRSGGRRQKAPPAYRHCECYAGRLLSVFSPLMYWQQEVQGETNETDYLHTRTQVHAPNYTTETSKVHIVDHAPSTLENKQPARQNMASTTANDKSVFAIILLAIIFILFIFFQKA